MLGRVCGRAIWRRLWRWFVVLLVVSSVGGLAPLGCVPRGAALFSPVFVEGGELPQLFVVWFLVLLHRGFGYGQEGFCCDC